MTQTGRRWVFSSIVLDIMRTFDAIWVVRTYGDRLSHA